MFGAVRMKLALVLLSIFQDGSTNCVKEWELSVFNDFVMDGLSVEVYGGRRMEQRGFFYAWRMSLFGRPLYTRLAVAMEGHKG